MSQNSIIYKIQQNSWFQAGLMCLFWFACEWVVHSLNIPLPSGALGLMIIVFLLITRCIKINYIKRGAELLLRDMLLFFIPAVLAVLEHHEFFGLLGLKILCVIFLSTLAVMLVTALVVDYCYHWRALYAKSSAR